MAYVRPVVQFSPATGPTATPTWVDITNYVMGNIDISYGRSSVFDDFGIGSMNLTLDNRDRRFDPSHSSGPYFGNLKPRRRIRVTVSGTPIFTGFIEGWPQSFDDFSMTSVVNLRAYDGAWLLSGVPLSEHPYGVNVLADAPRAWYKLSEDSDDNTIVDQTGNFNGFLQGDVLKGITEGVLYPPGTKSMGLVNVGSVRLPRNGTGNSNSQTIEFWMRCRLQGFTFSTILAESDSLGVTAQNLIWVRGDGGYGQISNGVITTPMNLDDDAWHHVVFTCNGTTQAVYVDGDLKSSVASAAKLTGSDGTYSLYALGRSLFVGLPPDTYGGIFGQIHNLAFYNTALSATKIADHYRAAFGWRNERSDTRVSRILDYAGWPTADRTIDTGIAILGEQDQFNTNVWSYLQELARSEAGAVFIAPDGKVRFRSRHSIFTDTGSSVTQATFGDSGSDLRFRSAVPAPDDKFIVNDVSAGNKGGRVFRRTDAASITDHYNRSMQRTDLLLRFDHEAASYADWILFRYKAPAARVESFTIDARFSTALQTQAINRTLGDRVVLRFTPMRTGSQNTYTGHIESVRHSIGMGNDLNWFVTYSLNPADIGISPIIVGTSTVGSTAIMIL